MFTQPVLEELVLFQKQIGDFNAALHTLTEYRRAWNVDADPQVGHRAQEMCSPNAMDGQVVHHLPHSRETTKNTIY